ncbi:hypothetical protein HN51_059185 [Arachis hypogaea]
MSQNGKLIPNLDQHSTKLLNLTDLQRIDPFVEEILITAAHVTFYEFNIDLSQWSRNDVEGSLFVVKRNKKHSLDLLSHQEQMKRFGHHLKLLFNDKKPSQSQTKQLCRGFCQGTKVVSPNQDDFAMISPRIKLRDGRHLAYLERGVSKDVAKYKIIIVHGFGSSKEMNFLAPQELINELGIYLLQYDQAGYGESDPNPKRSLKSEALDIQELADQLELGPQFYVRELSIEFARVGGVEIPNNKRIEFSLQYIHGIGRSRARKILCDISMDNKVTKDLSEEDLITLRDEVSKYQRKKKNNSSMAQTLAMPIAPSLALISNPRPLSRAVYFPVLNPPKVRELSIECAQVGGVEIPNNKRIEFSLQYIHGIGRSRARKILCDISMDNKVTKDLSEEDLITLRDEVSKYVIEGDLRRFNALNIRRLNYDNVKFRELAIMVSAVASAMPLDTVLRGHWRQKIVTFAFRASVATLSL